MRTMAYYRQTSDFRCVFFLNFDEFSMFNHYHYSYLFNVCFAKQSILMQRKIIAFDIIFINNAPYIIDTNNEFRLCQ